MCCLKKFMFGYGWYIINLVKGVTGKLKPKDLPDGGITNDVNNLVLKFDKHWRQEPKDNPNIWRVTIKTL